MLGNRKKSRRRSIPSPKGNPPSGKASSEPSPQQLRCSFEGVIEPFTYAELSVAVNVAPGAASGGLAAAEITGAACRRLVSRRR